MTSQSARRLLLGALALSILLHLVGVRFVHWGVPTAQEPPASVRLIKISKIRITARPTLRPRPRTPQPRIRAVPINVPKTTARNARNAANVAINAGPPMTPSPVPTPAHLATPIGVRGCLKANAVAAVLATPLPPEIPAQARRDGSAGVAQIRVQLNDRGDVVETTVASSSGNTELDQVAIALAKTSTYAPDVVGCKKVAATYTYRVRFEPATTSELR